MKLSVIVPVYNEQDTILPVIARIRACGVEQLQIIIVNDASTDATAERLATLDAAADLTLLQHCVNQGKGAAIRTAQSHIHGDVVVIQDADLEYSPEELPKLLQLIAENRADVVYGSRYSGREILVDTFWHYLGNKVLTTVSNIFANIHLTDMETCYKMIRADIFTNLQLQCNRFGIEPELTAKLARRGCRIYEVPIRYEARLASDGKKIGWRDGVAAFWYILKFNLWSR